MSDKLSATQPQKKIRRTEIAPEDRDLKDIELSGVVWCGVVCAMFWNVLFSLDNIKKNDVDWTDFNVEMKFREFSEVLKWIDAKHTHGGWANSLNVDQCFENPFPFFPNALRFISFYFGFIFLIDKSIIEFGHKLNSSHR